MICSNASRFVRIYWCPPGGRLRPNHTCRGTNAVIELNYCIVWRRCRLPFRLYSFLCRSHFPSSIHCESPRLIFSISIVRLAGSVVEKGFTQLHQAEFELVYMAAIIERQISCSDSTFLISHRFLLNILRLI